jgi:hypothetical protein
VRGAAQLDLGALEDDVLEQLVTAAVLVEGDRHHEQRGGVVKDLQRGHVLAASARQELARGVRAGQQQQRPQEMGLAGAGRPRYQDRSALSLARRQAVEDGAQRSRGLLVIRRVAAQDATKLRRGFVIRLPLRQGFGGQVPQGLPAESGCLAQLEAGGRGLDCHDLGKGHFGSDIRLTTSD